MHVIFRFFVLTLFIGFGFLHFSGATTFVNRPLAAVLNETNTIIRGHVQNSHTDYEPNGSGRIMTYTRITVDEVIKGSVSGSETILVRQPGGAKDGMEMRVSGTAEFEKGEQVVVLLGVFDSSDQSYPLPGLATAKYIVENNREGDEILVNSLSGAEIYARIKPDPRQISYNDRIKLEDFREFAQQSTKSDSPVQTTEQALSPSPPLSPSPELQSPVENQTLTPSDKPKSSSFFVVAALVAIAVVMVAIFRFKR